LAISSIPKTIIMNIKNAAILKNLTPDVIIGKLFSYHNKAHLYHLQTHTIGHHKLLDELYKALVDSKDDIGEYLLGVQVPERFSNVVMDQIEPYSDENLNAFLAEGFQFTISLIEYAKNKNLEELANLASDLQQSFVKAQLFMTYK